jgi:xylose isomerase
MSIDRTDLFHGHIGGMDTLARSLLVAHAMYTDGALEQRRAARYAGWDGALGRSILAGDRSLKDLRALVADTGLDPAPVSGRQEALENIVNRYVDSVR